MRQPRMEAVDIDRGDRNCGRRGNAARDVGAQVVLRQTRPSFRKECGRGRVPWRLLRRIVGIFVAIVVAAVGGDCQLRAALICIATAGI